jgi:hypothetical protein
MSERKLTIKNLISFLPSSLASSLASRLLLHLAWSVGLFLQFDNFLSLFCSRFTASFSPEEKVCAPSVSLFVDYCSEFN